LIRPLIYVGPCSNSQIAPVCTSFLQYYSAG
jgi:hypothetical protein